MSGPQPLVVKCDLRCARLGASQTYSRGTVDAIWRPSKALPSIATGDREKTKKRKQRGVYKMENRHGNLARWAVAAIPACGLLLLAGSGFAAAALNGHNFHGRYVASYHAFDASITGTVSEPNPPAIPYAVSGAMVSDGKGNVSGFLNEDYGSPGTGAAATCSISGTYTVGTALIGTTNGFGTINLTSSCQTVTCTGTTAPSCAPSGSAAPGSPVQLFCALSGPAGKTLDCTEMGEAASGTTFQTPISAAHWARE